MRPHFVPLIFSVALLGQSTTPVVNPSTFHVAGTMTQCGKGVPNLWVTFDDGKSSKTVKADATGSYDADLPLGIWTATATLPPTPGSKDERPLSHPHPFRVTTPSRVILDIYLRPPVMCDLFISTSGGRPPTQEQEEARDTACYGEEFFRVPSADGVPFEVDLGGLHEGWEPCSPWGVTGATRQFATYNLLSMQADNVAYHADKRLLEASGDVLIEDESGTHRADSVAFHIQDGRAIPVQ
jgi:hypothetical protein